MSTTSSVKIGRRLDLTAYPRDIRRMGDTARARAGHGQSTVRRLVVPVALAVTLVAGAVALSTVSLTGCGDDNVPRDAGVDTPPDTPII